ncbi:MAG: hypothetical protein Kow0013_28100 [Pararhodobacter sp.]
MKPNALIVGSGKAGSTSLHQHLSAHPDIFGSTPKELMYFSSKFENGEAWFLSHFKDAGSAKIRFESTPQYAFRDEFPLVPAQVHAFDPNMKIMYIVREPISRIVSLFNHWARVFPERYTDLEDSLSRPGHRKYFVERTRYFYQIEAYRALFPDAQIKVVFLEDLCADFVPALNDVFAFLGVAELADTIDPKIHNKRPKETARVWTRDDISAERVAELHAYLKPDVQALFEYCGKPADFWGASYQ